MSLFVATAEAALSGSEQIASYYFPGPSQCTVLVDFAPSLASLDALTKDEREASLANGMLREISANIAKCGGSAEVRALAVMIPGTDNYGRPNFASRKNLLMLEGPATAVVDKGSHAKVANIAELGTEFKITEY
jgi:hypothetical protein